MIRRLLSRLVGAFSFQKKELNLVYFLIFSLLILAMTLSHFYIRGEPLLGIPLFFFLQALGQVLLETGLFFLIAFGFNRYAPRWLFHAFIGFSFAILLFHFIDFTLLRLMDTSISYMFLYLFKGGILNLVTSFQALNLSFGFFLLALFLASLLPFFGIALYFLTQPLSNIIHWRPSLNRLALSLILIGTTLFALDLLFYPMMTQSDYDKFQKALPLGTTFLSPERNAIECTGKISPPRDEITIQQILSEKKFLIGAKPNIYLFIIETFRADFITDSIAPNLTDFAKNNLSFEQSFSNANGTHPSWFSIFHSIFPHHWTAMQKSWTRGSVPLQILKELGYKTKIYTSSDLHLFHIDQLIFGQERKLIDQIADFTENRSLQPCDRDALCLNTFFADLEKPDGKEGNLFIFFFDSPHSEYSVPKDFPLKFLPIIDEIDYLTISSKEMEPLKNRYRNAISYVDTLLGQFFDRLKTEKLYDQSIIAITGDHGEEFFEEGALFHGTHLNKYQTAVPLYYKFKDNPWIPQATMTTHLDIFPSILHFLTGQTDFSSLFDGESLFTPDRWPYRFAVLQNGPETPAEFVIENETTHLRFRFVNPLNIYETNRLEPLTSIEVDETTLSQILAPLIDFK